MEITKSELGFDDFTFVDLVVLMYEIFHKEKIVLCWKNKDWEEGRNRIRSTNLEAFYCVLPLLVETSGRLLPPFEMMSSSSKGLLWLAKGASCGCKLLNLRWLK